MGYALLVEDDLTLQRVGSRVLGRNSRIYEIRIAADGMQGLKIFTENSEDCIFILTDNVMPRVSGMDLLTVLSSPAYSERFGVTSLPPRLMYSGTGSFNLYQKVRATGAAGLLTKPVDVSHLQQVVTEILEHDYSDTLENLHARERYKRTVLVIDNDESMLTFSERALKTRRIRALTTGNGVKASEIYNHEYATIGGLFVTHNAGTFGSDALTFLRQLRTRTVQLVPAVIVTDAAVMGSVPYELATYAHAAGAVGFLATPFTRKQLTTTATALLDRDATTLEKSVEHFDRANFVRYQLTDKKTESH
jgi:CheY-like chemotaxis protein